MNIQRALRYRYYRARTLEPIWRYVLNGAAGSAWKSLQKPLPEPHRRIVEELHKNGIVITSAETIFGNTIDRAHTYSTAMKERYDTDASFREEMDAKAGAHMEGKKGTNKTYISQLYSPQGFGPVLDMNNPLIQLSLDERVLQIVGHYIGVAPMFHSYTLARTKVIGEDEKARLSQRWHRDPEDKKMLKMFIYFNDVDEDGGPFTYLKGSQYGGKWRALFPQIPPVGRYPEDGAVEKAVPQTDILTCIGKRGTVIFADTSGLHKGGYCKKHERILYTAGYSSWANIQPRLFNAQEATNLPPLARFALK